MRYLVILLATLFLTHPAEAKHRHHVSTPTYSYADPGCDIIFPCIGVVRNAHGDALANKLNFGSGRPRYQHHSARRATVRQASVPSYGVPDIPIVSPIVRASHRVAEAVTQYLPHPVGCPGRAFCGCGAAHELGLHDRSLWLAASWYKFPRSSPAPGTAAVRRHHVFVLKSHIEGNVWLVADYNSGHHQSRLHARSIAGYTIVSPRGDETGGG